MVEILKQMKLAIDEGVEAKAVQLVPHFVLLRRSFYFNRLQVKFLSQSLSLACLSLSSLSFFSFFSL